jgi:hypothetical protein
VEGAAWFGPHTHPEVSMHTPPLADYFACLERGDSTGVGELMLFYAAIAFVLSWPFARRKCE